MQTGYSKRYTSWAIFGDPEKILRRWGVPPLDIVTGGAQQSFTISKPIQKVIEGGAAPSRFKCMGTSLYRIYIQSL